MKSSILIMIVCAALLAACGVAPAAVDPAPAADSVALTLPASVDAQTVADVKERDDVIVLDVREQWEYDAGHIPGVVHIPMNDVPARLDEIPADQTIIVSCQSGNRSSQVSRLLRDQGYERVHNLTGGIRAWQSAGYPVEQ